MMLSARGNELHIYTRTSHHSVKLRRQLFRFFEYLIDHPGRTSNYEELADYVFGKAREFVRGVSPLDRMPDIAHDARNALTEGARGFDITITSSGGGYKLDPDTEPFLPDALEIAQSFMSANKIVARKRVLEEELIGKAIDYNLDDRHELALRLTRTFVANVPEGIITYTSNKDLPLLLLLGFPVRPDHRMAPDLAGITSKQLCEDSSICQLLIVARITQIDYQMALDYLIEASPPYNKCVKRRYILGQIARKLNDRLAASVAYERAMKELVTWTGETCRCGLTCKKSDLWLNVCRGRAVLHRAAAQEMYSGAEQETDPEKAAEYLKKAAMFLDMAENRFHEGEELVPAAGKADQAECWYSYGYLAFERGYLPGDDTSRELHLRNARIRFEKATEANGDWSAPPLRIGILQLSDGRREDASESFTRAWMLAIEEEGFEADLTRVNAAFSLALLGNSPKAADAQTTIKRAFETRIPPATQQCHAFDNSLIRRHFRSISDPALVEVVSIFEGAPPS